MGDVTEKKKKESQVIVRKYKLCSSKGCVRGREMKIVKKAEHKRKWRLCL
jgi:hypothetical protein